MHETIIDAHIHLWDLRATPRPQSAAVKFLDWNRPLMNWMARRLFPRDTVDFFGAPDHLLRDYMPADYAADVDGFDVEGFVHVQAGWQEDEPRDAVDETRWLEKIGTDRLKAIVGNADLSLGAAVDDILAAHVEASPRFRGVRHSLANHPARGVHNLCDTDRLTEDDAWREGYALLAKYNLSFDATVYHHQLGRLASLARDFPDVPIVLCHAGTPAAIGGEFGGVGHGAGHRQKIARDWRKGIAQLAEYDHVSVKISGLAMPVLGFGYHRRAEPVSVDEVVDDFGPLVEFLLDTFGAERCMFASNFPVDKVSLEWATLHEAMWRIVATRTPDERRNLFSDTARRVYRF